jgi:hypothetical protein
VGDWERGRKFNNDYVNGSDTTLDNSRDDWLAHQHKYLKVEALKWNP